MPSTIRGRTVTALAVTGLLALSACGGATDENAPVDLTDKRVGAMADYTAGTTFRATEPVDVSVLFSDNAFYPYRDDWALWSEITDRTGVTLNPTVVPQSDFEQRRSLLIGAGDAPTILTKTYPGQELDFVASGAVLPVSQHLDLMPHLQEKIEDWELGPELDTLRADNGSFYVLPGVHENVWQDYTLAFRTDELERLGLPAPTTWDEVYDALTAIKAANPDVIPLTDRQRGNPLLSLLGVGFGTTGGWSYDDLTYDEDTGEFVYTGGTPEYREMLEFAHRLVADGLLDPEAFTQDDDAAIAKFASGRAFAISTNAQMIVNDYRPGISGIPGATVAKIPFPAGPAGEVLDVTRMESGIMLSSAIAESPHFVATMQFIDWLFYSDEGQELARWGVEGETYTKDAAGEITLDPGITFSGFNVGAPEHLQKNYGFAGGNFAYGGPTALLQSTFTDEELAWQQTLENKEVRPPDPPRPLSTDERDQASLWRQPLIDFVEQNTLQFIVGQRDLSTWDAYVAELNDKGARPYTQLANEAAQRYQQNN